MNTQEILTQVAALLGNVEGSSFSASKLVADYLAHKQGRVRDSSMRAVASRLRSVVRHLGDAQAIQVSHDAADEYLDKREGEGVSRGTAAQEITALGTALTWAVRRRKLPYSPLAGWESGARQGTRDRVYTDAEIDGVLRVAKLLGDTRTFAVVSVMRWTGIRPIELLRSRKRDLDAFGVLHVPDDVAKTGVARDCVLQPEAVAALAQVPSRGSAFLLESPRDTGKHASLSSLEQGWRKCAEASGLASNDDGSPPLLYSMRHTLATKLALEKGYGEFELCQAMGWADVGMARKYVRGTRKHLLKQAERLRR